MIGVSRTVAAEFTFFLAIPVMLGRQPAETGEVRSRLYRDGAGACCWSAWSVAFIVSILVIRFLMDYIKKHDFKVFGWYRIVLGILVLLYFFVIR